VFLDPADAAAFLAERRERDPVVADAVEVGLVTALRRENVLKMTWFWLQFPPPKGDHLTGGTLTVPTTKNDDPQVIPLTGSLLATIDRRWQDRRPGCPWVFHHKGRRAARFVQVWDAAREAIGRGGIGPDGSGP
jgi:integrase